MRKKKSSTKRLGLASGDSPGLVGKRHRNTKSLRVRKRTRRPRNRASLKGPQAWDDFLTAVHVLLADYLADPRTQYMRIQLTENGGRSLRIGQVHTSMMPLRRIFLA